MEYLKDTENFGETFKKGEDENLGTNIEKFFSKLIPFLERMIFNRMSKRVNFLLTRINDSRIELVLSTNDDKNQDGNWRITIDSSGDLLIENRISGTWTEEGKISVAGDYLPRGFVVFKKASGNGIKIDQTTPTFGWRDLLGEVIVRNTGASKPTFATYRDTLSDYKFAAGDEEFFDYHIPHDYVLGTDIHLHIHWSHTGNLVTGGTVTFEYEISYSKGHNQAAFSASVTATFNGTASTTQYQHIITEIQISAASPSASQIDSDDLEPDGVIMARLKVTSNDITVSGGAVPDPFIHYADVHYQSTNISTKDKVPDFYA